jgi:hypothetical protein
LRGSSRRGYGTCRLLRHGHITLPAHRADLTYRVIPTAHDKSVSLPTRESTSQDACVNLIRYADDFIITGRTKELLEGEIKPLVEQFLHERGLELSPAKTVITHVEKGFDFLGQNVRKYPNGKLLIKPSKKNGFGVLVRFAFSGMNNAGSALCAIQKSLGSRVGACTTAFPVYWVVRKAPRTAFYFIQSAITGFIASEFLSRNRVSLKEAFEGLELWVNFHAQFLEGWTGAIPSGYSVKPSTTMPLTRDASAGYCR